jgi:hypothetical protein
MDPAGHRQNLFLSGRTDRAQQLAHVSLVDGADNTLVGLNAGAKTSGRANTLVGANVATDASDVANNVCVGARAAESAVAVHDSVVLGHEAAQRARNAAFNVVLGSRAGQHMRQADLNVVAGYRAAGQMVSGARNVMLGAYAGFYAASAVDNTFAGHRAGMNNRLGARNVFVGAGTGRSNLRGDNNAFVGVDAGAFNAHGSNNVFLGASAGVRNTLGSNNVFVGASAGAKNLVGNNLVVVGHRAGANNANGDNNVFLGPEAGANNTDGSDNVFVGPRAGADNVDGDRNTFVGSAAGENNTNASNNTFVGSLAGQQNTQGNLNTFVGSSAGQQNTQGDANVFVGSDAGRLNTLGSNNTFVGLQAGYENATGTNNVFVGGNAGRQNAGSQNTFVGSDAGRLNTSGSANTFVGLQAGSENATGADNVFVGGNAGRQNATGTNNVFVGGNAGRQNTGSQNTFVGSEAGQLNTTGTKNTFVGRLAGYRNATGASQNTLVGTWAGEGNQGSDNTFVGTEAGRDNRGSLNTFVGVLAGVTSGRGGGGGSNTFVGAAAGERNTLGSNNVFLGVRAGANNVDGSRNTFVGPQAGATNASGESNTFVGALAGEQNALGSNNVFVGDSAGANNVVGARNTFVGVLSGRLNASGESNTFVGALAGEQNALGFKNTFVGDSAGQYNGPGSRNVFLGHETGRFNTAGSFDTFVGDSAGKHNSQGFSNTFVGAKAGEQNALGSNNTFVGNEAGQNNADAVQNTYVGYGAGRDKTEGNENTFVGVSAGQGGTRGDANTLVGFSAGYFNAGNANTFVGWSAGKDNTLGSNNTFVGALAGQRNTLGSNNVIVGDRAGVQSQGANNVLVGSSVAELARGNNNVIVGTRAAANITGDDNVIVGTRSAANVAGNNNVIIGSGVFVAGPRLSMQRCVVIGRDLELEAGVTALANAVVIGQGGKLDTRDAEALLLTCGVGDVVRATGNVMQLGSQSVDVFQLSVQANLGTTDTVLRSHTTGDGSGVPMYRQYVYTVAAYPFPAFDNQNTFDRIRGVTNFVTTNLANINAEAARLGTYPTDTANLRVQNWTFDRMHSWVHGLVCLSNLETTGATAASSRQETDAKPNSLRAYTTQGFNVSLSTQDTTDAGHSAVGPRVEAAGNGAFLSGSAQFLHAANALTDHLITSVDNNLIDVTDRANISGAVRMVFKLRSNVADTTEFVKKEITFFNFRNGSNSVIRVAHEPLLTRHTTADDPREIRVAAMDGGTMARRAFPTNTNNNVVYFTPSQTTANPGGRFGFWQARSYAGLALQPAVAVTSNNNAPQPVRVRLVADLVMAGNTYRYVRVYPLTGVVSFHLTNTDSSSFVLHLGTPGDGTTYRLHAASVCVLASAAQRARFSLPSGVQYDAVPPVVTNNPGHTWVRLELINPATNQLFITELVVQPDANRVVVAMLTPQHAIAGSEFAAFASGARVPLDTVEGTSYALAVTTKAIANYIMSGTGVRVAPSKVTFDDEDSTTGLARQSFKDARRVDTSSVESNALALTAPQGTLVTLVPPNPDVLVNVHPDNALLSVAGEVGCRGLTVVPPGPEIDGHFMRMSQEHVGPSSINTPGGWGEYRLRLLPPLNFAQQFDNTYNTSQGGYNHQHLSGTFDITLTNSTDKLGFLKIAVVRANPIPTIAQRVVLQELANVATANLAQSYAIIGADRSTLEVRANADCRMGWRFEGFLSGYGE